MKIRPTRTALPPDVKLPLLALVFSLGLGQPGLHAESAALTDQPVSLSSASSPQLRAAVELNYAVRKGDLARAEKILAGAPSLLAESALRQTLFLLAAQEGQPAIIQWLLAKGAGPNDAVDRQTPLAAAVGWTRDIMLQRQEDYPEIWKQLGEPLPPGTHVSPPALPLANSRAARTTALEALRDFLAPMPPDVLTRKAQVVELLLAARAKAGTVSPVETGSQPLVLDAIMSGFGAGVIHHLIQAGADPSARMAKSDIAPLHAAAMADNLSAAEALLAHHVDPEDLCLPPMPSNLPGMQIGTGGNTPLMVAIVFGRAGMVRFLLDHGVNVETSNRTMDRALHFAARIGDPVIMNLLLERGARVSARDRWQCTPLHYASLNGNLETIKLLLQAKADLEAADEAGFTPLLSAAEHDHLVLLC